MYSMHCLPFLKEDVAMWPPNGNGENGYRDPHVPGEDWFWVPGRGWKPPVRWQAPVAIPPNMAIETQSINPEGVQNMFGMKLWTILLIAAAIAYFMNK